MSEPEEDRPHYCWCCQGIMRDLAEDAAWLDDDFHLPCCRSCWEEIPPADQLKIAMAFHDRSTDGLGVRETLDAIRDLISQSIAGYFNRFDDPTGRVN